MIKSPKIVLLGVGMVGSCFLEMLSLTTLGRQAIQPYHGIVCVDRREISLDFLPLEKRPRPMRVEQFEVQPDNVRPWLESHIETGDLLMDLSYNICSFPLIEYCLGVGANYINTSLEKWEISEQKTLTQLHEAAIKVGQTFERTRSTALVTHGMNPGLISHFVKQALLNIAEEVLQCYRDKHHHELLELKTAVRQLDFPRLAYLLDVKVIHCSEDDTQVTKTGLSRKVGQLAGTWGPQSLYEEATDSVQIGLGTHEFAQEQVLSQTLLRSEGSSVVIPVRGMNWLHASYVHDHPITGMLICHSENETLSKLLTYRDPHGQVIAQPSVYYVYSPLPESWLALDEIRRHGYQAQPVQRLDLPTLAEGADAVGALLLMGSHPVKRLVMGSLEKENTAYWFGSVLRVEDVRQGGFCRSGPTVVQVGTSLLSSMVYLHRHPAPRGVIFPEDLPHEPILKLARPYLGQVFEGYVPYHPSSLQFQPIAGSKRTKKGPIQALRQNCMIQ